MSSPPPPDQPTVPSPAPGDATAAAVPGEGPAAPTRRRWLPRRRPPAEPAAGDPPPETGTAPAQAPSAGPAPAAPLEPGTAPAVAAPRRLRRDRRRLIARREEAVYHLGGLAFELYRRDMLVEQVMRARAGEVAQIDDAVRDIDARLGEIDRERRERRRGAVVDPAAGCCLTCRTPFRAEARFCWQCGTQLVPPSMGDEQVTAVISVRPAP